ncbi:16S rRNA (cytosine(1402)-N(4))-methyltransferase RsmH [candidate division KSB1 bacterium]|nr:16S rRNA (cytosine(1402)-N(4))-methyltransferase RsmH [candidate division KSB1 bacterium]MBL7092419.1 16S rRNA (cytosine(1402)-N(4))-methyltransferase RsmH [candidate division KSB1 bacterium]
MNKNLLHIPVLVDQVLKYLEINPSGTYVDCTLGGGSHSYQILSRLGKDGKIIGLDWDDQAIEIAGQKLQSFGDKYKIIKSNFASVKDVLLAEGISGVNGILLDLGTSSFQIDIHDRGFSYLAEGPLDMRMSRETKRTAADILNAESQSQLSWIFKNYGEERRSNAIARAVVKKRQQKVIETTKQFTNIIESVTPFVKRIKTLARCYQAVRIATNFELENLQCFLDQSIDLLLPGGRLVIISFHSLEDRLVKNFLNRQANPCECPSELPYCVCNKKPTIKILTRKVVTPSNEEIQHNSRSRSSKLRSCEKF